MEFGREEISNNGYEIDGKILTFWI